MSKERQQILQYWEKRLGDPLYNRIPPPDWIIKETIKALEELEEIKEKEA